MKRTIILSILIIITVLFFSCGKKEGTQATGEVFTKSNKASNVDNSGYVLRVNASLFALENNTGNESDKTKSMDTMSLGEKITIGKGRRVTFHGDGKPYDFVEVRRENGKEGFAWANQVAVGSIAVVVDEKANMFKAPKSVDITGKMVSRKTIVVMISETESNGFIEFKAYDPIAKTYLKNFIRIDSLSEKEYDIQSSILMQTAEPLKNEGADKVRKDALLEIAVKDYPDSIFVEEIYDLIDSNTEVNISGAELVSTPIKE